MFMALGAGAWVAGIFHLFAHGFFKGLLFLGAGSVIHSMGGEQDMRKMGGLRKTHPDHLLDDARRRPGHRRASSRSPASGPRTRSSAGDFTHGYYVVWAVGVIARFLTAFYMFRLIFLTFWGESRADARRASASTRAPR